MSRAAEPPHPHESYGLPALRPLHLQGKKSLPTTRTDDKLSPQPTQPPFPTDTLGDEAKSLPRKTICGVPDTIGHGRRPKAAEDKNHHKRANRSITRHPIVFHMRPQQFFGPVTSRQRTFVEGFPTSRNYYETSNDLATTAGDRPSVRDW